MGKCPLMRLYKLRNLYHLVSFSLQKIRDIISYISFLDFSSFLILLLPPIRSTPLIHSNGGINASLWPWFYLHLRLMSRMYTELVRRKKERKERAYIESQNPRNEMFIWEKCAGNFTIKTEVGWCRNFMSKENCRFTEHTRALEWRIVKVIWWAKVNVISPH